MAILGFKPFGIVGGFLFLYWLLRVQKPSLYGIVFSLLCVYIPLSGKFETLLVNFLGSLPTGINPLNLFFFLLLITNSQDPAVTSTKKDKLWGYFCIWGSCIFFAALVSVIFNHTRTIGDVLVILKRWWDPIIVYYFARKLQTTADRSVAFGGIALGTSLFAVHLLGQGLDFGDKVRVGGLMNDPNAAAAFMAAYISVFIAILSNTHKKVVFLVFFALTLVGCLAEFQTVSRGGALGIGISILASVYYSRKKSLKIFVISLLAIIFMVLPSIIPNKLSARFAGQDMHGSVSTDEAEVSFDVRLLIWSAGVKMCLSNPLGIGIGNFQNQIGDYGGPPLRDAHNIYLLVCAEMGWLGLFFYLMLLFVIYRRAREGLDSDKDDWVAVVAGQALIGATIALVFTNMFSATLRDIWLFGYLAILAAIIRSGNIMQKVE